MVSEYISDELEDHIIEETETVEPLIAITFEEEKEEITTEK